MKPKLSVLVITRNHAPYIAEALRSVLDQDFSRPWEVLIGDDASSDGTDEIVAVFAAEQPDRVINRRHTTRVGMHANVADLLDHCRGDFVALLDGDDYWTNSTKLERQVAAMERDESVMCGHSTKLIDLEANSVGRIPPKPLPSRVPGRIFIEEGIYLHTSSLVFRRDALPVLPPYVLDPRNVCLDHSLEQLICTRGDVSFLEEFMSVYRRGSTEISQSFHEKRDLYDRSLLFILSAFDQFTNGTYHKKLVYLMAERHRALARPDRGRSPLRRLSSRLIAEILLWRSHAGRLTRSVRPWRR